MRNDTVLPLRCGIGVVMETDTARAILKALYPTIIVITGLVVAVSWSMRLL